MSNMQTSDPTPSKPRFTGWNLAIGGFVAALFLAGVGGGAYLLLSGSEQKCTPRFCAEVLGPIGNDAEPMTPVRIRLSGVDQEAATRALSISNAPQGATSFDGDVLTFKPEWPGFARGVTYDVGLSLDETAVATGRSVDLKARFTTGGKLEVQVVMPVPGTKEVAADTEIYVQFNRSVAPLTVLAAGDAQNVIEFSPPIEGTGRWLNTSLYVFKAAKGWQPSTAYSGRVKAGLTTQLGSQLDGDYPFDFSTVTPAVLSVAPLDNSKFIAPQPEVRVEFNQPVDRTAAEQSFSVSQVGFGSAPIPGSFEWQSELAFVFRPEAPLVTNTTYASSVASGVKAATATAVSTSDHRWTFTTVEAPRVLSTSPRGGTTDARNYGVNFQFATPMDQASIETNLTIEPKPENDTAYANLDSRGLNFSYGVQLKYSTEYRVRLAGAALDRYGTPLGADYEFSFTTGAMQPQARMFRSAPSGTFNAYLEPTVMVSSWNVDRLDFKLYRIDQDTFIKRQPGSNAKREALEDSALVRSWSVELRDSPLNTPVVTEARLDSNATKLSEGFYVITLDTPNTPKPPNGIPYNGDELPFLISSVNVTTKWTDEDVLIWAVDLKTGQPYSGWRFDVLDPAGKSQARGTTDGDGIARIDIKSNNSGYPGWFVTAKRDNRLAFSSTAWSDGISPYNYGASISSRFQMPELVGHMFTDRPIYRPGETVYMKGSVRADDDTNYTPPAGLEMKLAIYDQQGRQLESKPVAMSDYGTFDSSLALAADAAPGVYNIRLTDPVAAIDAPTQAYGPFVTTVSFRVAEFVKPQFEVTVTTDKNVYVNGEQINATISSQFYFGSSVSGAQVKWKVTGGRYEYRNEGFTNYRTGEYTVSFGCMGGSVVSFSQQQFLRQEGIGQTDLAGLFSFSLPADISSDTYSQQYTVEAIVTDVNQQQVSAFINVPVHKGRFYIGLQPATYSPKAGSPAKINAVTIDPLTGKSTGNIPLEVAVFERRWRTVRERAADGQQVYKSVNEDIPVSASSAVTRSDGLGSFDVTLPRSGQFYISVTSVDDLGNKVRSSTVLWASGNEFASWHVPNDDRFTIVPDKEVYKPGDTARILIAAPFEGESIALVSQERGKVLAYETRRITGNSEVLELPIVASHVPNFYLSVVLFKPATRDNPMPQVKFGLVELRVSNEEKNLNISLVPSATRLHPRDKVSYDVRTTDSRGRPVQAEVALALVDKAVFSLQDDFARPGIDTYWSKRPLGVITASSYTLSVDRANELAKSIYPGGKGGGGSLYDEERSYFPNTAFWEPSLKTDNNGRGRIEVDLPDSTTTWRLTARGITADTRTGEGRVEIVTARDLVVRPDLPRFLTAGDEAKIGVLVGNTTQAPLEVAVTIEATGVRVDGPLTQLVTVPAGQSAPAYWPVGALAGHPEASFSFSAVSDGATDAVAAKLPMYSYFTAQTVGTAGDLTSKATEAISVPGYVRPDAGGLTVNVAPSLVSTLNSVFTNNERYFEYEGIDSTVGRFVSAIALERAIKELKLTDIDVFTKTSRPLAQKSLQKIYESQHADGGWGWWKLDASDPLMTAWVVSGLGEAKRAGYSIDPNAEKRASAYLKGELNRRRDVESPAYDLRAFMLYALALDSQGDLAMTYSLAEKRSELSLAAKAWLVQSLHLQVGAHDDPRFTRLLDDLQTAAVSSATGTHWEETKYDRSVFGNTTTTTTQVIRALNLARPDSPLLDGAMRWLMLSRKDGRWPTTYNNTAAPLTLSDYIVTKGDLKDGFDYSVSLNGRERLEGEVEKGVLGQEHSVTIEMRDLVKDEINDLLIARHPDGVGRLYYTAHLEYFTPAEDIEAVSRGIGVSHEYFRADVDSETPVREVELGDTVKVRVTLVAPAELNYVSLVDYLPAGLEPLDSSLKITPLEVRRRMSEDRVKSYQVNRRNLPFGGTEIRDNRIGLFARTLRAGVYEYTYYVRATTAGSFRVPPATASERFFPEVFGHSDGGVFVVKE